MLGHVILPFKRGGVVVAGMLGKWEQPQCSCRLVRREKGHREVGTMLV